MEIVFWVLMGVLLFVSAVICLKQFVDNIHIHRKEEAYLERLLRSMRDD